MLDTRLFRSAATTALAAIAATLALAGPMAGTAFAARPTASAQPNMTSAAPLSPSSSTTVSFTWTTVSSGQPAGISETFSCFLDGAKSNCGSGVSGTRSYSGLTDGTHSFFVKGKQTGHYRAVNSATTTWRVDRTAPLPPTVHPVSPNPTSNTAADIYFEKADTDTASFVCALDDSVAADATGCVSPYNPTNLAAGTHTLYVYALDAAQPTPNESAASHQSWLVDLTAPGSPVFTSQPNTTTNSTTASFAWTDDPTATSSQCSLDSAAFTACSPTVLLPKSVTFTGLAAGPHTLVVRDRDSAGNTSTALATWSIDLTAPPAPQIVSGPAATTDQTSASFLFQDADTTATFLCSVSGNGSVLVASSACTSPYGLPSLSDGSYTFSVQAKDPAGNVGPLTPYSWTVDTTDTGPVQLSPVGFLSGPGAFSNVAHPSFTWVALDDLTTGFVCALDSNDFTSCGSPDTNGDGTYSVPAAVNLTEGPHMLAVKGADASANLSPAATYSWTYDKTPPPAPMFSTTPAQPSNSSSALFSFASEPNASFTCSLNAAPATLCASPVSYTGLAAGNYTFTVQATDAAGNTSHSDFGWTIDPSVPSAPVLSGPNGFVASTSAQVAWLGGDPGVTYTCALDGAAAASCTSPRNLTGLSQGQHTIAVTAVNGAKTSTSSQTWTVDTVKPVLNVSGLPANGTTTSASTVVPVITQTDVNPGSVSCSLTGPSGFGTCGPYVGLADGVYTMTVNTADAAGNAADAVTTGWTVDTTPPVAAVVSGPADTTNAQPSFDFSDGDAVAAYGCSVDGGSYNACSSPFSVPAPLGLGAHSLMVSAADGVGNTSYSAPFAFNVSAPVVVSPTPTPTPTPTLVTAPVGGPIDPAPTAALSTPTTLTGVATGTFSETVHALAAGGASIVLTGTSTVVPTNVACLSGTATVACSGSFTALRLTPRAPFTPGQHYTVQVIAGAAQDSAGNPSVANSSAFRGSRTEQENSAAARATWATVRAKAAYGHTFVRQSLAGATATYIFKGTNVTWWTVTGKNQGKATVYIDGARKAYVDNYAAATHFRVARRYTRLGNRTHTLRIVVRGLKGAKAGTGTFVSVDAFSVGKTRANTPRIAMTWRSAVNRHYSAVHAAVARFRNETLSFTFRGTAVSWFTQRGRNQGKVAVYVDGVRKAVVDNYAAKTAFSVRRSVTRLADKVHTLKLVVLGTHHRGATGTWVTVDRFTVT
jgi:hypothetical protein